MGGWVCHQYVNGDYHESSEAKGCLQEQKQRATQGWGTSYLEDLRCQNSPSKQHTCESKTDGLVPQSGQFRLHGLALVMCLPRLHLQYDMLAQPHTFHKNARNSRPAVPATACLSCTLLPGYLTTQLFLSLFNEGRRCYLHLPQS